jgi:cytochrome o ubiquinol oxidase subunit 1
MFATFMARIFNDDVDYYVPAAEVERIEREHRQRLKQKGDLAHSTRLETQS